MDTPTTSSEALLWEELDHWLYHALVPLIERHLQLEPCPAIRLAGEECGPMAACIRELVKQELASRKRDEYGYLIRTFDSGLTAQITPLTFGRARINLVNEHIPLCYDDMW